ncbi:kinase-like protein [Zalerion maritima]|uniref:Kinase-like protein n=1 Tax=Zalerion maritima TaxID=339359 RepID=A0AAD5RHM3_9PEZI|nr:kinase-like protein [Zalerion maritima]
MLSSPPKTFRFVQEMDSRTRDPPSLTTLGDYASPVQVGDSMSNLLRKSMVTTSNAAQQRFLPHGQIEKLITPENVRPEIQRHKTLHGQGERIVYEIFNAPGRRKLFAILVLIEQAERFIDIISENLFDKDLPLSLRHTNKEEAPLNNFKLCQLWSPLTVDSFETCQWSLLSPFFSLNVLGKHSSIPHYIFKDPTVLPFLESSSGVQAAPCKGGFGQVSRVKIHSAHHNFPDNGARESQTFALKTLHSSSEDDFSHEVEALKQLSGGDSPHIINLLATYQMQNKFNLIFDWATGGNLFDLWKAYPNPAYRDTILWAIEQWSGLSRALQCIHEGSPATDSTLHPEQYGRHGDIKPSNILCFTPKDSSSFQGVLKISDFGMAEFQRRDTKLRSKVEDLRGISPTYRPPESEIPSNKVTSRFDIWCIGCVYLEFVIWLLLGFDGVAAFSRERCEDDLSETNGFTEDKFFNFARWPTGSISSVTPYPCPYRKRNPLRFNVRDYQSCALTSFPSIPQLKRHVLKTHMKVDSSLPNSSFNCGRCRKGFQSSNELNLHLRAPLETICSVQDETISGDDPEDGVAAEMEARLRNRRPENQVLDWNTLWEVLFPNDSFVPSPDYETVIEDHEVIKRFKDDSAGRRDLLLSKLGTSPPLTFHHQQNSISSEVEEASKLLESHVLRTFDRTQYRHQPPRHQDTTTQTRTQSQKKRRIFSHEPPPPLPTPGATRSLRRRNALTTTTKRVPLLPAPTPTHTIVLSPAPPDTGTTKPVTASATQPWAMDMDMDMTFTTTLGVPIPIQHNGGTILPIAAINTEDTTNSTLINAPPLQTTISKQATFTAEGAEEVFWSEQGQSHIEAPASVHLATARMTTANASPVRSTSHSQSTGNSNNNIEQQPSASGSTSCEACDTSRETGGGGCIVHSPLSEDWLTSTDVISWDGGGLDILFGG